MAMTGHLFAVTFLMDSPFGKICHVPSEPRHFIFDLGENQKYLQFLFPKENSRLLPLFLSLFRVKDV